MYRIHRLCTLLRMSLSWQVYDLEKKGGSIMLRVLKLRQEKKVNLAK